MRLNAPTFWYKGISPAALLLSPLSLAYYAAHRIHQSLAKPYHAAIPVICLGNLVIGGSGKTPAAIAIMGALKNAMLAEKPCFVSRGYRGQEKGPVQVDPDRHSAADVGDEPLMLAQEGPVIIGANRGKSAELAEKNGYDAIVMDDGLQNPSLQKDIKFVVIDGKRAFGNGMLLPAGPLREPAGSGLKRADAVILIGDDLHNVAKRIPPATPFFKARMEVAKNWITDSKIRYVAFSGLADPEKFHATLQKTELQVTSWHPFPDHHAYSAEELEELAAVAAREDARLLTTAKDAARLPHSFIREHVVDILPIELVWEDGEALTSFLKEKLKSFAQTDD